MGDRFRRRATAKANEALVRAVSSGVVESATGERLDVRRATLLRVGSRSSSWLEIVLDEGKNRQIRRMLAQLGAEVLRLRRVAIAKVKLGGLPQGKFRELTVAERKALGA